MKSAKTTTVRTPADLARVADVSRSTAYEWSHRGLIVYRPSGEIDVDRTLAKVLTFKKQRAVHRRSSGGAAERLAEAKARLTEERARIAELERRRLERELVPVSDVEAAVANEIVAARTRLLGIPTRLRQRMPELPLEAASLVDALIREALEELASPDRVIEAMSAAADGALGEDDDEADA